MGSIPVGATKIKKMSNIKQALRNRGFMYGRMISESKSSYRNSHPTHEVYFNANIFTKDGKQWYGDLDLTLDSENLQKVADEAGEEILILRELAGRFENEGLSFDAAKKASVKSFSPNLELFS